MNKFRVTCLLIDDIRVFATRKKFATREEAQKYAMTIAEGRYATVAHCPFETHYENGTWHVSDPEFPELGYFKFSGEPLHELKAVWAFVEDRKLCKTYFYGVPCGGNPASVPDEGGSGYFRCDKCGML